MDGNVMTAGAELADTMAGDFERLQDIDRIVSERCGPQQVQDIVGNLLLMLQAIESGAGTRQGLAAEQVGGLQALAGECLRLAGVPGEALRPAIKAMGRITGEVGAPELIAAVGRDLRSMSAPLGA
ncbi:MAG: hypothetical protein ACKOUS_02585 [Alphaproteobacteria bacterium]